MHLRAEVFLGSRAGASMSAEALIDTPEANTLSAIISNTEESRAGYKHLTIKQKMQILRLDREGAEQKHIASIVGCSQPTVSKTLAELEDSREEARALLEAGASQLAQTVVNTKDAAVALKALGKIDVVRDDAVPGGSSLTVMIGGLEPPVIALSPVRLEGDERRSAETLAIMPASHKPSSVNVEVVKSKGQTARHNKRVNKRGRRA